MKRFLFTKKNKRRNRITLFSVLFFLFTVLPVTAQVIHLEVPIGSTSYVTNTNGEALGRYIAVAYEFLVGVVGVMAATMIMYAGVLWGTAAGNSGQISKAKEYIISAFVGLALSLGSYTILFTINPALVIIPAITPVAVDIPIIDDETGTCTPLTSGPCSVENLADAGFGSNAEMASGICAAESAGNASLPSSVDVCQPGGTDSVSWGLFQVNLTYHKLEDPSNPGTLLDCPSAFSAPYNASNHDCTVTDRSLYDACVAAAQTPSINIDKALELSNNGSGWRHWGANSKCGYPE